MVSYKGCELASVVKQITMGAMKIRIQHECLCT